MMNFNNTMQMIGGIMQAAIAIIGFAAGKLSLPRIMV